MSWDSPAFCRRTPAGRPVRRPRSQMARELARGGRCDPQVGRRLLFYDSHYFRHGGDRDDHCRCGPACLRRAELLEPVVVLNLGTVANRVLGISRSGGRRTAPLDCHAHPLRPSWTGARLRVSAGACDFGVGIVGGLRQEAPTCSQRLGGLMFWFTARSGRAELLLGRLCRDGKHTSGSESV